MHPSPRSKIAFVLLVTLLAYNVLSLASAGANDAASEEATAATEEVAEEEAPAEEAAPEEELAPAEEPAPAETSASNDETPTVSSATRTKSKTWTKTRIVRPVKKAALARPAGPGTIFIANPGQTTANNNPQQGGCTFDIVWQGFSQNPNDTDTYEVTPQGSATPIIASGSVTLSNGAGTTDPNPIEFTIASLAGVPLHNDGTYHVEARSTTIDTSKQKTFKVHASCGPAGATTGTVVIDKVVTGTGASGTQSFDFTGQVDGSNVQDMTANDTAQTFTNVTPGQYSVGEANIPTDWDLTDITCKTTNGSNDANSTVSNDPGNLNPADEAQIDVSAGETVTCTFTNTYTDPGGGVIIPPATPAGTIVVDKVTVPAGSTQSFNFTVTPQSGAATAFSLTDAATPFSKDFVPGTYAVAETVPSGWDLTSVDCGNEDPAAINLATNETVTCTFTNIERATITAELETIPPGIARAIVARVQGAVSAAATTDFNFSGDLSGVLTHGQSLTAEVVAGTYSTTQTVPSDFTLTSISCNDTDSSGNVGTATATFNAAPGEDVTCTFVNVLEEVGGKIVDPGKPGGDDDTEKEPEVLSKPPTALPVTGSDPVGLVALAGLLILMGAATVLFTRKHGRA